MLPEKVMLLSTAKLDWISSGGNDFAFLDLRILVILLIVIEPGNDLPFVKIVILERISLHSDFSCWFILSSFKIG